MTSSYPAGTKDLRDIAGIFVKGFAKELVKKNVEATVFTQQTGEGPAFSREGNVQVIRFAGRGKGVPLSTLKLPKDFLLIASVMVRGILASFRFRRNNKVDYILAFWAIPCGLWALSLKWIFGVKYAVWCLGSDVWDNRNNILKKSLLRVVLKNAHRLYADGYTLCTDVRFISGVECQFLPTTRRLPDYVTAKAKIPAGKKNFLFIGRYHLNKGPDVLLEAIAALDPLMKEQTRFHFFGGGPLYPKLKDFIIDNHLSDIVSLNGYIDEENVVAYLKACDALIIPSRLESIPVVLSDALQTESPIVVTDVGDMGYLVRQYQAGIVVRPESPGEMAKAIKNLVLQNGDRFIKGRKSLLGLFELSSIVETFLSNQN